MSKMVKRFKKMLSRNKKVNEIETEVFDNLSIDIDTSETFTDSVSINILESERLRTGSKNVKETNQKLLISLSNSFLKEKIFISMGELSHLVSGVKNKEILPSFENVKKEFLDSTKQF